ncbi:MAG: response regulator transcription factor, partial [Anaerolineales bacterium]|nr:response regulator transcription factor [Anaerolineales bacterium]
MMSEQSIRILIADDHPVFRFGLRALLEAQSDMVVVGEAEDGETAVTLTQSLQPDVVLMDINMPGINGIEATKQIADVLPETAVLIITMFDDDTVFTAMQAGARGYLLKGAQGDETLRAIRAVANGEVIFSPGVAEQMMAFFMKGGQETAANVEKAAPFPELTPREREILELLAQGLTNTAIAEKLVLSPKTIRNQVSNIFSKLQVASRSEAIVKARE